MADNKEGRQTAAVIMDSSSHQGDSAVPVEDEKGGPSKPESAAPPDGGAAAWLVVLGAWCSSFCSFGWLNSIGVFQDYYQAVLLKEYSASEIAWIPSLQIFFMLAVGPFVGSIYDRHGPHVLLLFGSFFHVFGLMMVSISKEYYQVMLAQGVCSAIGASTVYQPALAAAGGWFDQRRGLAFGVLFTGSSIGGVIFPIMVNHLIPKVGFGWAMRISAFLILFLLIITNLTIKCRLPPVKQSLSRQDLLRPFGEIKFVLVIAGFALLTFGIFVPIDYLVVQAAADGMSKSLSDYMIPILNSASFFGRLGAGIVGDKLGRYNAYIIICYFTAIIILALWLPASGNAALIVFATLYGFSSGAYISLSPALIAQVSPYKELGYRLGLLMFFASFPGLATNPIAGAILSDSHGSFSNVKIYAGVFCLAGTTSILMARVVHSRKVWTKF